MPEYMIDLSSFIVEADNETEAEQTAKEFINNFGVDICSIEEWKD